MDEAADLEKFVDEHLGGRARLQYLSEPDVALAAKPAARHGKKQVVVGSGVDGIARREDLAVVLHVHGKLSGCEDCRRLNKEVWNILAKKATVQIGKGSILLQIAKWVAAKFEDPFLAKRLKPLK